MHEFIQLHIIRAVQKTVVSIVLFQHQLNLQLNAIPKELKTELFQSIRKHIWYSHSWNAFGDYYMFGYFSTSQMSCIWTLAHQSETRM